MTELEKMDLAECYINRYFEFAEGVEVSKENKEYLKIYIREVKNHQIEVNEGITEQIELLEGRIKQLEKQRDDYLAALRKKIDFMELDMDYMTNIGQIKEFLVNGEAETCEEAVEIFEQSLLMQQMTGLMSASVHDVTMDIEKNKERFGDPTENIGKKPQKKNGLFGKKSK